MSTISKSWLVVVTACSLEQFEEPETTTTDQASCVTTQTNHHRTVTTIRVNGRSADTFLIDGATNGYLYAARDQVADVSALDFSYATPDVTDPNLVELIQGAGEIPNTALEITSSATHLHVTTAFEVTRCVVDLVDGSYTCAPLTAPVSFDLTWVRNGVGSLFERTFRLQTLGPVTTRFRGQFTSLTSNVGGTWASHTSTGLAGNLLDTESTTSIREVTRLANL